MSVNKALVLFAHGKGFVLRAECEDGAIEQFLSDIGVARDGFDLDDGGLDYARACPDGLWVGDLSLEDDGPGDWEGTREVLLQLSGLRPITAEEWMRYRRDEWIWIVPPDEGGGPRERVGSSAG